MIAGEVGPHTTYLVQAFVLDRKGFRSEPPSRAASSEDALRKGERLAARKAGVVVFSCSSDGDPDGTVVLCQFGEVPPNLSDHIGG